MSKMKTSLINYIEKDGKNPINTSKNNTDQNVFMYHPSEDGSDLNGRKIMHDIPGRPGIAIVVDDGDTYYEIPVDENKMLIWDQKVEVRSKWIDTTEIGYKDKTEPDPYAASQGAIMQKAFDWAVKSGYSIETGQHFLTDAYNRPVDTTIFKDLETGETVDFNQTAIERGWAARALQVGDTKSPNYSLTNTSWDLQDAMHNAMNQGVGIWSEEFRAIDFYRENQNQKDKESSKFDMSVNSKRDSNAKYDLSLEEHSSKFKIGDVWLDIPPTHISVNQLRSSYNIPLLGFEAKPIQGALTNRIIIKVNTIFESEAQINTDLKRIIYQFKEVPINIIRSKDLFFKVAGEASWLNTAYGMRGDFCVPVTMDSYTLYTIEGHPGTIGCSLQFSVFNFSAYFHGDPNERVEYFKLINENFSVENGLFKLASNVRKDDIWATTVDLEDSIHPYNFTIDDKIKKTYWYTKDGENKSSFSMVKIDKNLTDKEAEKDKDSKDVIAEESLKVMAETMVTDLAQSISISYSNNFAWQPLLGYAQPIAQYIGPGDVQMSVNIKTNNKRNVTEYMKTYSYKVDPGKYGIYDDRYFLDGALVNFADVKIATVQHVSIHNIEGKHGWYDVNLMFNKSTYPSIIIEGNEPQSPDEYWGLQRINKLFKQETIAKYMDRVSKVENSVKVSGPLYSMANPLAKDVDGLNIVFKSDVNAALEFIDKNWSKFKAGTKASLNAVNKEWGANVDEIKSSPLHRMVIAQAKLKETEVKDVYKWEALKARQVIQENTGLIVLNPDADNDAARQLKGMIQYEALISDVKDNIRKTLEDGNIAAAMDGRYISFDIKNSSKEEAQRVKDVFERASYLSGIDDITNLSPNMKATYKVLKGGVTRIYVTSRKGNSYKNSGELLTKKADLQFTVSEPDKRKIIAEMQGMDIVNKPKAAHRYLECSDAYITSNLMGSRTNGYWYACSRIKDIQKQISNIEDSLHNTVDIHQDEDAWKAVMVKETINGKIKNDINALIDPGNPFSVMKASVFPSIKKRVDNYEPATMDIDKKGFMEFSKDGNSTSEQMFPTIWSDGLLNTNYMGAGQKMKALSDTYAKDVASRLEYGIPQGSHLYLDTINNYNNVKFGAINTATGTLSEKATFSNSSLSNGLLSDISKVSTPVQRCTEVSALQQYVLSLNKSIQYSGDTKEKPQTPKPVTARVKYDDTTPKPTAKKEEEDYTPKPGEATVTGASGRKYKSKFGGTNISTTSGTKYYTNNNNARVQKELDKQRAIAAQNGGTVASGYTDYGFGSARGSGISEGAINDQIANFMHSQLPTFGIQNAFPTFKMYIIADETSEYKYKMLDMYWDYRLVQDMMVIRDKNNPSHILKARVLVDPRYTTTSGRVNQTGGTMRTPLEHKDADSWDTKDTAAAYSYSQSRSPLRQGMRICIKLGYHTDPRALDTVFIGTITSLHSTQDNGIYTLEARGDGRELLVPATIQDSSLHGDNFADLINMMLRSNPNIRHFGKVYGSFLERFSREHQEWVRFLSQNILTVPIFTTGVVGTAALFPVAANPIVAAIGTAVGLSGLWLSASVIAAATIVAGVTMAGIALSSDTASAQRLVEKGWYNWHKFDLSGRVDTWWEGLKSRLRGQVFDANKAGYQLSRHMHHVYEYGNNPIDDNIFAVDIFAQDQGKNVNLKVNNQKSVWDVLVNIKRMYPGWALDVRPYGNRSTLYLGPLGFNYFRTDDPLLAMAPSLIQMEKVKAVGDNATLINYKNDAVKGIIKRDKFNNIDLEKTDGNVVPFVPFIRHHMVSSYEDIIFNGIRCTPERGWNSVVVTEANNAEPEEFVANEAVFKSSIRRRFEVVDWTSNERLRKQYAIGLLKEGVEKLYGGSLIIRGNPKIEPYDRIQIVDHVSKMYGTIEVETVIHKYDNEMGFTTHIVPNMVCSINDSSYLTQADITKRALLDKWRNLDAVDILENAAIIGAGVFVPFWPLMAMVSVYELGKFFVNNKKELSNIMSVTDISKDRADKITAMSDIGWAVRARQISIDANLDVAEIGLAKLLRGVYKATTRVNPETGIKGIDWQRIKNTRIKPDLKNRSISALGKMKGVVDTFKENKTQNGYLEAAKSLFKKSGIAAEEAVYDGMTNTWKRAGKVIAAEEATEMTAFKRIASKVKGAGGPVLRTTAGLAIFMALEALPLIFETTMFKAATKNQIISIKPLWYKDSFMMQGLEGYKNTDMWMHMKDVIINMGEVADDMWESLKSWNDNVLESNFDNEAGSGFGEAQADEFTGSKWYNPLSSDSLGILNPATTGTSVSTNISPSILKDPAFLKWKNLINTTAEKYSLDPALVHAIVYTESKYNEYAFNRNKNGSVDQGLMQLNSKYNRIPDPYDPASNVNQGTKFLAGLVRQHGLADGVRRYNGSGPDAERYSAIILQRYSQFKNLGV